MKHSALMLLCLSLLLWQTASGTHKPIQYTGGEWWPKSAAWTRDEWTGDERPFAAERRRLDALTRSGNIFSEYIRAEARAVRSPNNALAQYSWAYSMLLTRKQFNQWETGAVSAALERVPSPATFEFARVRFLFDYRHFKGRISKDAYGALGERLITREPNSKLLKGYTAGCYSQSDDRTKSDKAIRLFREILALDPKQYQFRNHLATCHYKRWLDTKDTDEARQAIKEYDAYFRHYQSDGYDDVYRRRTQEMKSFLAKRAG